MIVPRQRHRRGNGGTIPPEPVPTERAPAVRAQRDKMKTGALTALQEFTRLEASGRWTPTKDAEPQEVSVFFGEATLVIARGDGTPITHWSLPAIRRLNKGETTARYSPDSEATEALEIDDAAMIAAIEKVHKAIASAQPKPGRLRRSGSLVAAALVLGAVFWLPGALERQTLSLVPATTRAEIGATVLGLMQRETGLACRSSGGVQALNRLVTRLFGQASSLRLVVLPGEMAGAVRLPGGIIVLPQRLLTLTDDPYVFAGAVVAATARGTQDDPLGRVLDAAGLRATLTLLATGTLPAQGLDSYAHTTLTEGQPLPETTLLQSAFAQAALTSTPWAQATAVHGGGMAELAVADPMEGKDAPNVMSDADWISLKAICSL